MFAVGLDVDTTTSQTLMRMSLMLILVSKVMVTLLLSIGLYAGKLGYFLGPLSYFSLMIKQLFGKIQISTHSFMAMQHYYLAWIINEKGTKVQWSAHALMKCVGENEQSADNFDKTDEFNNFIEEESHISDHLKKHRKPQTEKEFGYYLAGLIEGDGYFGDHRFERAFHEEDTFLAYYIKKRIGYGSVLKLKGKNSVRYVLRHSEGLKKVLNLVNGKFLTNKKIDQLVKNKYDLKFNINILPPVKFDLFSNHWLAGFSDADGSFVIHLAKSKTHILGFSVRLEFKIKQKTNELLELIKKTLGGNLYYLESEQVYYYNSTNFKSAKLVVDYFDNFHLNSSKFLKYFKWRKVYRMIQRKEHLELQGLEKIRKLQKNLRD